MITKRVVLCWPSAMSAAQRHEAVDLAREFRGDGGLRDVARLRHVGGRAGGVGMDDRLQAELVDQLAALRQGMDMAVHGLDRLQRGALGRQQVMHDALEMLADDVQARFRHQVMHVGDAAGERVVDGDHRQRGAARRAPAAKVSSNVSQGSVAMSG